MRFFSKIAFFFNLAFLFAVGMRLVERRNSASPLATLQPVENTLIVMGYLAILINALFLISFLFLRMAGRASNVARWIWIFNSVLLVVQVLYFFVLP